MPGVPWPKTAAPVFLGRHPLFLGTASALTVWKGNNQMKRTQHRPVAAGLAALSLTALAGCGPSTALTTHDGMAVVKVGQLPVVDTVAFAFAVDNGYFKQEGIEAKADFSNPGAMVTSLVNGSDKFVLGETAIVVSAYAKGLPVRVIGGVSKSNADPSLDSGGLLVMKNGPVKKPADLNGRTIAVGALNGGGELALRAALDKDGARSDKVKFLEMPLADMTAALVKGRVAAISTISPFDVAALDQGAVRIMSPGAEAAPRGMQMAVATNADFQRKHPKVVQGFLTALRKGDEYAAAHPDAVRKVLPSISPIPANLIAKMQLPVFDASNPRAALKIWTDLMERYKFVSGPVDLDKLMS